MMKMAETDCVFINCPFDKEYKELLRPMMFTLIYFHLLPVLATIRNDSGEQRLSKILSCMKKCKYSIHDLSRLQVKEPDVPRMNMPFELGIDFGIRFSGPKFSGKRFLVLELCSHDLKPALSDIAGCDPKAHGNSPEKIVSLIRDWVVEENLSTLRTLPDLIWYFYLKFWKSTCESIDSAFRQRHRIEFEEPDPPNNEFIEMSQKWVNENRHQIESV
jgi:hypothetical protein